VDMGLELWGGIRRDMSLMIFESKWKKVIEIGEERMAVTDDKKKKKKKKKRVVFCYQQLFCFPMRVNQFSRGEI
jgi:sulfur transfer protein SufE